MSRNSQKRLNFIIAAFVFFSIFTQNVCASTSNASIPTDYFGKTSTRIMTNRYWDHNDLNVYCVNLTSSEEQAVKQALAVWSNITYSSRNVKFYFNMDCSASESDITITKDFIPGTNDNPPPLGKTEVTNSSGLTDETGFSRGVISHAKITINTTYSFTTGSLESGKYDLTSLIAHEMGHVLGIAHCHESKDDCSSNCDKNIMGPILPAKTVRITPQTYDKANIVSIYTIYHPFS